MNTLESLKTIFKDRLFKIPDYQRGYAWTTKQLKDFWEDLVNLPSDRYHYTELLSLKKVDRNSWKNWNDERWLIEDRGFKPFHIVDGQQRLTTFVIFIQAISEHIKTLLENKDKKDEEIYLGSFSLKAIKEEYLLVVKPPQFIIRTYKFGYEVDNPSFKFLRHKILSEPDSGTVQETFYTLNLENAKRFFKENLQNFFDKYGLSEIEVLFKKVTQNLMFNIYEISDDFDVFVAFETMNNRGKMLSKLELLKNRLIYLTTLYDEEELKDDERIALRERINDSWKEVYYQLGRNKKNPLNDDDFLVAHWIMYFQYTREKGDDYIKFLLDQKFTPQSIYAKTEVKLNSIQEFIEVKEDMEQEEPEERSDENTTVLRSKLPPKEIEDYVNSLKAAAVHWYNTHNPANNSDLTHKESLWIDRLNRIGITYFRPLVTVSFLTPNVDSKNRIQLFEAIERFIFIVFRMGRAISTFRNSEFFKITRLLRINETTIDNVITRINNLIKEVFSYQSETDGNTYLLYGDFMNYIEKKFKNGAGGFYAWNGLRYFLYEYEMDKVSQRGSQKIDWNLFVKSEKDKISIEHIYPQTPTHKNWKDDFKDYKKSYQPFFQGTLGNLLPLSQSINSSLQNDCFEEKKNAKYNDRKEKVRQGYHDGSHSEIEVAAYDEWTPETILQRGEKLIDFMEKRWNFNLEGEDAKTDLLFLNFMLPEDKKQ